MVLPCGLKIRSWKAVVQSIYSILGKVDFKFTFLKENKF